MLFAQKLLVKVSDGYENTQFEEGLEIIFTWRQARASNDFKERLEIRIGDFYAEIYHPGLPKMLMYQFFHDDPVSPDLKNSFMINFPALLNNELSVSPKAQTRVKRSPTPVAPESVNSYETNILFSLPFRAYFSTSLTASNMWSFADKSSSFIPSPSEIANRCVRNSQEDEEHSIPSMASTYSPSLVVKVLPTVVPTFQSLTNSVLSTVEYVVPSATEVSSSKPFDTEELETNSESSNSDSIPDLSGINSEESLICEGKVCKSDQNILRKKWKNFRKKIEEEVRVNKKLRDPFSELFYEKDLQQKSLQKAIPRRNFCYKTSSDFFTANRIAYIFIIIYFIILIVVSMPPALVKRGIKIVENSKRRSLKKLELIKSQFNNTLQKTLSKTSSLAKLARPTSADLKFFFK